jgi:hypothetical protein
LPPPPLSPPRRPPPPPPPPPRHLARTASSRRTKMRTRMRTRTRRFLSALAAEQPRSFPGRGAEQHRGHGQQAAQPIVLLRGQDGGRRQNSRRHRSENGPQSTGRAGRALLGFLFPVPPSAFLSGPSAAPVSVPAPSAAPALQHHVALVRQRQRGLRPPRIQFGLRPHDGGQQLTLRSIAPHCIVLHCIV